MPSSPLGVYRSLIVLAGTCRILRLGCGCGNGREGGGSIIYSVLTSAPTPNTATIVIVLVCEFNIQSAGRKSSLIHFHFLIVTYCLQLLRSDEPHPWIISRCDPPQPIYIHCLFWVVVRLPLIMSVVCHCTTTLGVHAYHMWRKCVSAYWTELWYPWGEIGKVVGEFHIWHSISTVGGIWRAIVSKWLLYTFSVAHTQCVKTLLLSWSTCSIYRYRTVYSDAT